MAKTKIDWKNRNSRKDKRRKNMFKETISGDWDLVMDFHGLRLFDNSMGRYNHLLIDFIETLDDPKVLRKKFQKFLQKYIEDVLE